MIIKRLILKNWRNFQNADVNFSERSFIVGSNAAGKSNLLDVFRFLRDVVKQAGGLQQAVESRGGIKKIRCLSARYLSNISIEVHLADAFYDNVKWKYLLDLKHSGGGVFKSESTIISEKVWSGESNSWVLNRNQKDKSEDSETLKYTHLEQVTTNKLFREIAIFFNEIQYLNIVPLLVRESDSFIISKGKEDFYGRNFLERISKLNERTRTSYFKKINEVLRIAVPQLEELKYTKDEQGIPHLEARYVHWRAKGSKQREDQFSDGTLRLIGFLWALLDGTETVLLEEPEINLHSEIIRQLPEFIAKLQKKKNRKRQVLTTTHSYDLLDNPTIGPKEVIVLLPSREGTDIKVADDVDEIRDLITAGFTIAEATAPVTKPKEINQLTQLNIFD
jgi:predicted ATPase